MELFVGEILALESWKRINTRHEMQFWLSTEAEAVRPSNTRLSKEWNKTDL